MSNNFLHQQNTLLQNRERVLSVLKKYPHVINVGVGLKEVNDKLTSILCYRVYVREKRPLNVLQHYETIPSTIDGFTTDVIQYGVVDEIKMDDTLYRPLLGGIQIKNDYYVDIATRGGGTMGCLALLDDGSGKIVGLTNYHVVALNSEDSHPELGNKIGQPWKHICCCCCVKNIVGNVLNAVKSDKIDCAIFDLHDDIVDEIKSKGAINDIAEIGGIKGIAMAEVGMRVKKRGAGTGLTHGVIKDIAFDNNQILIGLRDDDDSTKQFADFGDSGAIILNEDNLVIGMLWASERNRFRIPHEPITISTNITTQIDPRVHGVATPIAAVEAALGIRIPVPPPATPTISIHNDDTKTHAIPSILPSAKNPKQHFVTVKGDGDIILSVVFNESIDANRVGWVSDNPLMEITYPAIGTDKLTAKIKRNSVMGLKAMVGVTVDGYSVGEKVFVWIIWSQGHYVRLENELQIVMEPADVKATRIFRGRFQIQPSLILPQTSFDDVPDLQGPNVTPPPNVPDTDSDDVFNKGVDLSGGANLKWDASVSIKYNIVDHAMVSLASVPGNFDRPYLEYPSSPLVGNFDTSTNPAEDPYGDPLPGEGGSVGISVAIEHILPHTANPLLTPGAGKIEFRIHHRLFARVELAGNWYLISDINEIIGRTHLKYTRLDESTLNTDLNHDGDKTDFVWYGSSDVNTSSNDKSFYDDSDIDFLVT